MSFKPNDREISGALKAYFKTSTFESTKNVKTKAWMILMVWKRKKCDLHPAQSLKRTALFD